MVVKPVRTMSNGLSVLLKETTAQGLCMRLDPESVVRGGPNLISFFLVDGG